ncbi:MAG: hypothetical protein AAF411_15185 [Myxococcota bacterium]
MSARYLLSLSLITALACGDDSSSPDGSTSETGVEEMGADDMAVREDTSPSDDGVPETGPEDTGPGDTDPGDTDPEDTSTPPEMGPVGDAEFQEVEGLVVFEAEHFFEQIRDEATRWYAFEAGAPPPDVECVTNTECSRDNTPDCNEYPTCDGDDRDPSEASGGIYLEALPDRRRTDDEANTGGRIGVVNNPDQAPTLIYRVNFTQTGRYYVWAHAHGQGPAANGLHVGLDGEWPENDLIDPSSMRLQFRNGWRWTQTRRGGRQHTGVSGTDEVSVRDANVWLQIDTPGVHTIELGMREDGLEIDKIILALDPEFEPEGLDQPETRL